MHVKHLRRLQKLCFSEFLGKTQISIYDIHGFWNITECRMGWYGNITSTIATSQWPGEIITMLNILLMQKIYDCTFNFVGASLFLQFNVLQMKLDYGLFQWSWSYIKTPFLQIMMFCNGLGDGLVLNRQHIMNWVIMHMIALLYMTWPEALIPINRLIGPSQHSSQ